MSDTTPATDLRVVDCQEGDVYFPWSYRRRRKDGPGRIPLVSRVAEYGLRMHAAFGNKHMQAWFDADLVPDDVDYSDRQVMIDDWLATWVCTCAARSLPMWKR